MLNLGVKDAEPESRLICRGMESIDSMGSRIRQLREAKGLTQPALGKMVGVTKGAVSQWENGSIANIKLKTVLKLCEILGTDLQYLVHGAARRLKAG